MCRMIRERMEDGALGASTCPAVPTGILDFHGRIGGNRGSGRRSTAESIYPKKNRLKER
jgi:hypothetical protein